MQLSKTSLATLIAAVSLMVSTAQAGVISCADVVQGGTSSHNVQFSVTNGVSFAGGPFQKSCEEMVGAGADPTSTYNGPNGSSTQASFSITDDGCMNIMTEGNQFKCCPGAINNGATCTF